MTLECTKNNSTGPHTPMNIIRDSLLAKITRGGGGGGISSGFGHMVAIVMRINTQALMSLQIIHRENLLHTQHSLYIVAIPTG